MRDKDRCSPNSREPIGKTDKRAMLAFSSARTAHGFSSAFGRKPSPSKNNDFSLFSDERIKEVRLNRTIESLICWYI